LLKGAFGNCTGEYIKSLIDPFENVGPRLGWGTMVPTTVTQIYLRGSFAAGASGDAQLLLMPSAKNMLIAFGGATNAWTAVGGLDALNAASVNSTFEEGRIISMGLKSWPNLALTAAPGVLWSGAALLEVSDIESTLVSADFQAFPTTLVTKGVEGGTVTGRPLDPTSFEFAEWIVNSAGWQGSSFLADTDILPFSIPYQVYTGVGSGTLINYECVINVEGTVALHHLSTPAIVGQSGDTTAMLSDEHSTVERLWRTIKDWLPFPSTPGIDTIGTVAKQIGNAAVLAIQNGGRELLRQSANVGGAMLGQKALGLITGAISTGRTMYQLNNLLPYAASGVPLLM